jgi:pimeloyl-ACP methyl ester carboxylesterase
MTNGIGPLSSDVLPDGIRSRFVPNVNGLTMHVLEAGETGAPCVLLLHGFPELAYSWRKVMPAMARAGYHVIAPDQRGFGRSTGWSADYDGDLMPFRLSNLVLDAVSLMHALGCGPALGVVGHDFGSPVAALCALIRPDLFRSVALMSSPFTGAPKLDAKPTMQSLDDALGRLDPPRAHYQWYYTTRRASPDMHRAPQGVHAFLRAYFHTKSADWPGNHPHPLPDGSAQSYAVMPTYYIMERGKSMAETVAPHMPSPDAIAACRWMTARDMTVYATEYERTGFQGALQWYRCRSEFWPNADLRLFAGRTIDVPAMFVTGKADWGAYQFPGALDRMQIRACTQWRGTHLLDGAGHWAQQEQPEQVAALLLDFLGGVSAV